MYGQSGVTDFFVLFLSLPLCLHDPLCLRLLDLSHNLESTWWNQMWSQESNTFIETGTSLIQSIQEGMSSLLNDFFKSSLNNQVAVVSISDQKAMMGIKISLFCMTN